VSGFAHQRTLSFATWWQAYAAGVAEERARVLAIVERAQGEWFRSDYSHVLGQIRAAIATPAQPRATHTDDTQRFKEFRCVECGCLRFTPAQPSGEEATDA
jgi:hypothetical protein